MHNTHQLTLNTVEIAKLASFAQTHAACGIGHPARVVVVSEATGIGAALTAKCQHCHRQADISDIDSW